MNLKIKQIDVFPVPIPMTGSFAIASGPIAVKGGMAVHVFVRIVADDGSVGWGECRPSPTWSYETAHTVFTTIRHYLAPVLIGRDPHDLFGAHAVMNRTIAWGPSTGQPIAKAAIDIALHDWAAKKLGVPLWRLFGGSRREINLSYTLTSKEPADLPAEIERARKAGYRHFNFKIGIEPDHDIEMGRTIRKIVGDGPFVWADANGAYNVSTAMKQVGRLAEAGVNVFEQPVAPGDRLGLQRLCATAEIPIGVDESLISPDDLMQLLNMRAVSIVVGKVTRCGGLLPARQIYDIGRAAGLPLLLSGLTDATCGLLCAAALASAYDIEAPCALNGPQFLADWTHVGEPVVKDGKVILSDRPGHGAVLDEARIEREAKAFPM